MTIFQDEQEFGGLLHSDSAVGQLNQVDPSPTIAQ